MADKYDWDSEKKMWVPRTESPQSCTVSKKGSEVRLVCRQDGNKVKVYTMQITSRMREQGKKLSQHPNALQAQYCIKRFAGDKPKLRKCMDCIHIEGDFVKCVETSCY